MNKNLIETIVGAAVLLLSAFCLYHAYNVNNTEKIGDDRYTIFANFSRADGIEVGSLVRISGIVVGRVVAQSLDHENYYAKIEMDINSSVPLPKDTSAEIISNGLLGDKYIALVPGVDSEKMNNGDIISFTQSSFNLESVIGKVFFGGVQNGNNNNEKQSPDNDNNAIRKKENDVLEEMDNEHHNMRSRQDFGLNNA